MLRRLIVPAAIFFLAGAFLPATKMIALNVTDISQEAARIFEGTCIRAEHSEVSSSNGKTRLPAIRYTFEVADTLKGKVAGTFTFTQLGVAHKQGQFPVNADQIGIPRYEVGMSYLIFLNEDSRSGLTSPRGLSQGLFLIKGNQALNAMGNRHIFQKMGSDPALKKYDGLFKTALDSTLAAKSAGGVDKTQLKALVRDILSQKVKTVSRKSASNGGGAQ